ncbi:hypothetical protein GF326_06485 [Candidatus Bathyarchaeota archaeon]|nr:hypothetical protein [Candidatus Bathyarchaeota archaeon]
MKIKNIQKPRLDDTDKTITRLIDKEEEVTPELLHYLLELNKFNISKNELDNILQKLNNQGYINSRIKKLGKETYTYYSTTSEQLEK